MKKSVKIIIIVLAVLLVLGLAVGAFFYFFKADKGSLFSKIITSKGESALELFDETGKDKDKIHIGDYVAYNEGDVSYKNDKGKEIYSSKGTLKWRVLGAEDGKLLLICDDAVHFSGTVDISKMNEVCELFGKGTGAEKSRCITDKDLEKVVKLGDIKKDTTSTYNALWRVANTYKQPEYEILFKNENGVYKEYGIDTNIEDINCANINSYASNFVVSFNSSKVCQNFMPIVVLKEDVEFDGKDENGIWKIKDSDKTYKEEAQYIEISNADDLVKLTKEGADLKANYKLVNDIDLSSIENFEMIKGTFAGIFDGNNHTISGLKIKSDAYAIGLFAKTSKATIKNLTVKDAKVECRSSINGSDAGILVGNSSSTVIINCNVSGTVTATSEKEGTYSYGLMAGSAISTGIFNSKASGKVDANYEYAAGGLIGKLGAGSYAENCIADAQINVKQVNYIGGFAGLTHSAVIIKCGVTGTIEATNPKGTTIGIGGFAFSDRISSTGTDISQCYSKVDINYNGKEAYICGFVSTIDDPSIHIEDSYCTGKINAILPEGTDTIFGHNSIYSFVNEGTVINCYSNITDVGDYSKENKLDFSVGTLYYNKDVLNETMDKSTTSGLLKQGTVVGLTADQLKNKDSFKDFDYTKKWKWNDEKSCLQLIFE